PLGWRFFFWFPPLYCGVGESLRIDASCGLGGGAGRTACRCCAPVPLAVSGYGRTLNSPGDWSPGPITSVGCKQQSACIPYSDTARGKQSDSPRVPTHAARGSDSAIQFISSSLVNSQTNGR